MYECYRTLLLNTKFGNHADRPGNNLEQDESDHRKGLTLRIAERLVRAAAQ